MARGTRYMLQADVLSAPQTVDDGYGGLTTGAATTIVSGYKCSAWYPHDWTRTRLIEQYGLTANAVLRQATGDYNAAIAVGHTMTFSDGKYRIIGVSPVQGGGLSFVSLALLLMKVQD